MHIYIYIYIYIYAYTYTQHLSPENERPYCKDRVTVSGFIWLRLAPLAGCCEHGNGFSVAIKLGWRSWLHCAAGWKVAGSIPFGVVGPFH